MYREIKPTKESAKVIDAFWTFSGNENTEKFKIFPDNCVDLIFDCRQNQAFVSGVMTRFISKEIRAHSDLIGIRFKTENFRQITSASMAQTKDLRINIKELIPKYESNVLEQVLHFSSPAERILFLQKFILKTLRSLNNQEDKLVLAVTHEIRRRSGNIKVRDLAKTNHISLRQLERRFKNYIGLTIKQFSNIIRFNHIKNLIAQDSTKSLLDFAVEVGFFDHSHMTNEFKRLSGESPSYFK